ncbi:hypothetical protein E3U23_11155 [Erythrobacter litoralis]|uniref:hypothetical protein n=1 Tax=Erythrobacter litoralis TaxID=39960 RepID=UPI002434CE64|nr:hypothetical protein [Erythrobacter litoralis]MDG6079746.1 hypothetical protein [Erythrobacter litoralis]
MSKALKTVGKIAGGIALVAGIVATGGALGIVAPGIAAVASTVATVAGVVAGVAQIGAQALAQPPPARGSITQLRIDPDAPSPYVMGEGYFAGVLRHRTGYGATLKKVPNPYLWEVVVYCVGGAIAGPLTPQFDFKAVGSYYSSFFAHTSQLGQNSASALVPPYGAAPGWGSSHRLSGQAAIGWNYKFDKDGERYASGRPVAGAYAKWVRVYDPRKDSTFPGGSGSHRLGNEVTYEYSENPALHAGTYAFGRYRNGKRVFGMGLPREAIDFEAIATWANDCDANDWRIFGAVFEPGDRWRNLRDICIAGGGEPLPLNTGIGFHWDRPRVVLDTITEADAGTVDAEVTAMQSYRDRINRIVPEYTSEADNWELVKAAPIVNAQYLEEDGEEVSTSFPFNLVKHRKQAGQLAAYRLVNAREFYPITIPCKPRLRRYRPGDCLHINRPDLGLDTPAIVLKREIDPRTLEVTLTMIGETPNKHAFALGKTATAPATPALGQTPEERDRIAAAASQPAAYIQQQIALSYTTDYDPADGLLVATDTTITVEAHLRIYPDRQVEVGGGAITTDNTGAALVAGSRYHVFYDDAERAGGAVGYQASLYSNVAALKPATPARHYLGSPSLPRNSGETSSSGGSAPSGWSRSEFNETNYYIP